MCMPCGPRRRSSRSYEDRMPAIKTRISKKEVREVIDANLYDCYYKMGTSELMLYEGCVNNLYLILEDSTTTVKVAGRKSEYFIEGYRTIIMDAPCFPAVVLLRESL